MEHTFTTRLLFTTTPAQLAAQREQRISAAVARINTRLCPPFNPIRGAFVMRAQNADSVRPALTIAPLVKPAPEPILAQAVTVTEALVSGLTQAQWSQQIRNEESARIQRRSYRKAKLLAVTESKAIKVSKTAIQQSLLLVIHASERKAAELTGTKHHRNVWNRAHTPASAKVKAWAARSEQEQTVAINAAWALIDADYQQTEGRR